MKKIDLLIISVSLVITIIISSLFGFAGSAIIGTFWSWFTISFLIQVIGFILLNSFLIQRDRATIELTQLRALEALSKFSISLTCAYCQQQNLVPIQLNQRNTFTCESCNQANLVTMQFNATALTTPIESVKIPIDNSDSIEFKVSR